MPKAPAPYARPPHEEVGPDGRTYFKVMKGVVGLQAAWRHGFRLLSQMRALKHPAAPAKTQLLTRHLSKMEKRIRAAEQEVAEATDQYVKERIKATQVRPDNPRGPSMINAIESRPIRFPLLPALAVGAVDIQTLNKATTRPQARKPYWRSQEWGSTHLVGRSLVGFFQPGQAAPSQAQFRQHPAFQASRSGFPMTIERPIEERAFLRSGVMQGALFRRRLWRGIEGQALKELRQILGAGGAVGVRRGRR